MKKLENKSFEEALARLGTMNMTMRIISVMKAILALY